MRPVVITSGKSTRLKPIPDRLTMEFFFPGESSEFGQIELINDQVRQIIVRVPGRIEVHVQRTEEKP